MQIQSLTHKGGMRVGQGVNQGGRVSAHFEGASISTRMGGKGLGHGNVNSELSRSLTRLRQRSLHAIRNHAYAKTGSNTFVDNLIGVGITAKWNHPELQKLWDIWIKECDADGLDNLYALQALMAREVFSGGESITRRRIRPRGQRRDLVPLRLQMVSGRQLDESYTDLNNDIQCGIQFNRYGERSFYHLNPTPDTLSAIYGRIRVPASDVCHVFERWEAGQVRGVPELSAVLIRLYEIDEMQDAALVRAKVAALFGAFVQRKTPSSGIPQEGNQFGEQIGEDEEGAPIERIKAGAMHYLDENEEVIFPHLPDVGDNYIKWLKTELRAVAKAIGLTYEQLTGDLEGVNYSSIRAGLLEFRRRIERLQWNLVISRWCNQVAVWFMETAVMAGMVDIPDYWESPAQYLPEWIPPKFEAVDRLKEVTADLMEMRSGLETRRDKVAQRGYDIDKVDAQLAREQASDLVLDSNPAKTDKTGALQSMLDLAAQLTKDNNEGK